MISPLNNIRVILAGFACMVLASSPLLAAGVVNAPATPLTPDESRAVIINDPELLANFSFARTIGQILTTSGQQDTQEAREAFVQTLIDNYRVTSQQNALITMPLTLRPADSALSPAAMLDPNTPPDALGQLNGMFPIALTNRLDLMPADGSYCGEQRIIYAKGDKFRANGGSSRLTIAFEAAIENPDPSRGAKGCEAIARFWQRLSVASPDKAHIQQELEDFFYNGTAPGLSMTPVVHFLHYGNPFGQVRTNSFILNSAVSSPENPAEEWMLREFRIDASTTPRFVIQTVNNSPWRELYKLVSLSTMQSLGKLFYLRASQCQLDMAVSNVPQALSTDLKAAAVNGTVSDFQLISQMGVNISSGCNGFESNSQNPAGTTAPIDSQTFENNILLSGRIRNAIRAQTSLPYTVTPEMVMNRINSQTCAGCHNASAFKPIAPGADGNPILWPSATGFVHIDGFGNPSHVMTDFFLPARFASLNNYLASLSGNDAVSGAAGKSPALQRMDAVAETPASVEMVEGLQRQIVAKTISEGDKASTIDALRASDKAKPGALVAIRPAD